MGNATGPMLCKPIHPALRALLHSHGAGLAEDPQVRLGLRGGPALWVHRDTGGGGGGEVTVETAFRLPGVG